MYSTFGLEYYGLGIQLHAPLCALRGGDQMIPQHIDQTHLGLQETITLSDATMWSQPEGHIGVRGEELAIVGGEALRLELTWLGKVLERREMHKN